MEWRQYEARPSGNSYWATTNRRFSIAYFPSSRAYVLAETYPDGQSRTRTFASLEEAQAMAVQWVREQQESQDG
jgi:hypothetical protein